MLFKKLFHLLVLGGAVAGATSGCSTTSAAGGQGQQPASLAPPGSATPKGGGVRGW